MKKLKKIMAQFLRCGDTILVDEVCFAVTETQPMKVAPRAEGVFRIQCIQKSTDGHPPEPLLFYSNACSWLQVQEDACF